MESYKKGGENEREQLHKAGVSQPQQQRGLCPHGSGGLCGPAGPHPGGAGGYKDRRVRGGDQFHRPRLSRQHRPHSHAPADNKGQYP